MLGEEKITIFDRKYSLSSLRKITKKNNNPYLEFIYEDLDYICDNSTVEFFEEYRLRFKNRSDGRLVDVYIKEYRDGYERFIDGQDSIYYIKEEKDYEQLS